jgi:prepilin-type N-terminal cleavage/methylation domain-containing protein
MNRKGFTLIELLIVVVIIGILAAIAIPKFANTKEKAYISSMKSDLRNMVTAEEAYFADSVKYTTATSCVNPAPAGNAAWCATIGNTLGTITIGTGTAAGWTTNITNLNTSKSCAIYVGAITPATPATTADAEGAPVCR